MELFDAKYTLDNILPLAETAYDLSKLPSGWTLKNTIQPSTFGFVAESHARIVIGYRGTEDENDWLHDFDDVIVDNPYGPGHVDLGFLQEYQKVRTSVVDAVTTMLSFKPYDEIIIVGHSLGAAMATLCGADIRNLDSTIKITGYTFESPRTGWLDFAHHFDTQLPTWWRISNKWDIVPHVPSLLAGYVHVGTEININAGFTNDLHLAHGLETACRPGLMNLISKKTHL
jgi:predicted lipase